MLTTTSSRPAWIDIELLVPQRYENCHQASDNAHDPDQSWTQEFAAPAHNQFVTWAKTELIQG